jgi:short-subunit dehydrogenase
MGLTIPKPLAVVTGASSGIGFELARNFALHGFDLILVADETAIATAARDLQQFGGQVHGHQIDLSTYDGVEELYSLIREKGRSLYAIAINAGIGVSGDFTRETSLEDELNMIDLNIASTVHLTKLVAADMVEQGHGRILFTSSIAAVMPTPFLAVYGGTKAFILSFSEALRNELKDTGVTVTALMPGPTDTNFFRRAGMEDTKAGVGKKDDPADVARQGFEAMMTGKDHVFAGGLNVKLQGLLAEFLPETLRAEMNRRELEPGSAEKTLQ